MEELGELEIIVEDEGPDFGDIKAGRSSFGLERFSDA